MILLIGGVLTTMIVSGTADQLINEAEASLCYAFGDDCYRSPEQEEARRIEEGVKHATCRFFGTCD
ncbi:hypothetical protein DPM19_14860 [Actinomadura craniellae]|uniref:Uncharacterized protein n=1 Tax=Actinomadura craniellae TaxID=2231787 RepID=A0A365H581_9ACTN|nr:hypothetical protein [Actinomadura craniellae]RAY14257.1 hypothetical protein DPM19_14860 [Actinomadura craniellae]